MDNAMQSYFVTSLTPIPCNIQRASYSQNFKCKTCCLIVVDCSFLHGDAWIGTCKWHSHHKWLSKLVSLHDHSTKHGLCTLTGDPKNIWTKLWMQISHWPSPSLEYVEWTNSSSLLIQRSDWFVEVKVEVEVEVPTNEHLTHLMVSPVWN